MNTTNISFVDSTVKMPLMSLPVRSTVITAGSHKILLSPGSKMTENDYKKLSGITDIVGTSTFHGAGVPLAVKHFPKARVWAAPGLMKAKPEIPWTGELSENTWPYQGELPMVLLEGAPKINEVVFYHPASKSLIVSDLFFNMTDTQGFGAWLIQTLFGTYRKFALSKFFMRFVKDRAAFEASLQKFMKFDFQQIIVSHGYLIESNGKERARSAILERGLLH